MLVILVRGSLLQVSVCVELLHSATADLLQDGTIMMAFTYVCVVLTFCERVVRFLWNAVHLNSNGLESFFRLLRSLPGVRAVIKRTKQNLLSELKNNLMENELNICKIHELPTERVTAEQILSEAELRTEKDYKDVFARSRLTGTVYATDLPQRELCNTIYCQFAHTNPLHGDSFPSVARMEAEVVNMASALVSDSCSTAVCGTLTSGGTESILTAIRASRDFMCYTKRITNPEMIVSLSAHAAVYKAAEYFNIKIIRVPTDENGRVCVEAVKKALRVQTILIYASAPTYPHGVVDPIEELSSLALQQKCCLHVDACLGGFVLPFLQDMTHVPRFDFSLAGVTSMSMDTHKYGCAQKGSSVLLYSTVVLRQFQYTSVADWSGGLYISPTTAGSRSGGLIAQTWAALLYLGREGYQSLAHDIYKSSMKLRRGIAAIDGLEVIGEHITMVVAWRCSKSTWNIYTLNDAMSKKGWRLAVLQNPSALHFCITPANLSSVEDLIRDLNIAVKSLESTSKIPGGKAPIYGLAHGLPDRGMVKELLRDIQDMMTASA